jgi:hypothetical protein
MKKFLVALAIIFSIEFVFGDVEEDARLDVVSLNCLWL